MIIKMLAPLFALALSQHAGAWVCNASLCVSDDPYATEFYRIASPRKGVPAVGFREFPRGEWVLVDTGAPAQAIGVCIRARLAMSRAQASKQGEQIGVQVRAPGVETEHYGNMPNGLTFKGREVSYKGDGFREDGYACVASSGPFIEVRWSTAGWNPFTHRGPYAQAVLWLDKVILR